jgi:CRISPR-associated protein Cmr6
MQACRDKLRDLPLDGGQHAGLLLSRYLKIAAQDDDKKHPEARKDLHKAAQNALSNEHFVPLYQAAFERWKTSLSEATTKELHVQGRLIVGLGGDNVMETGITLHHTYGVPCIPGSALKGLAAHYCNTVWGEADDRWKKDTGEYHKTLFGDQDSAGHILFHDAWITPDSLQSDGKSGLAADVMTPHHQKYYMEGAPPTDFDDPNPVTFLSVTGSFLVALSCDVSTEEGNKWASLALNLLKEALREWGIGGKTSSGYGRLAGLALTTSPAGPAAAAVRPTLTGPRYTAGTVLKVERVQDPKDRGRLWFQADDGFSGTVVGTVSDTLSSVEIGQTVQIRVAAALQNGYNFRLP